MAYYSEVLCTYNYIVLWARNLVIEISKSGLEVKNKQNKVSKQDITNTKFRSYIFFSYKY